MRVRYTPQALADLNAILDYISIRSPQGARRVQARIQVLIGLLPVHPLIGTRTDDPSIRRLATPPYPYLAFYEVAGEEIIIHAIRHAARGPSPMLGTA
ncbi:MAG: type II toxin-antitoxin system RelE/ParE family toxin [Methylocella sp.]